jgi:hypothetical protein
MNILLRILDMFKINTRKKAIKAWRKENEKKKEKSEVYEKPIKLNLKNKQEKGIYGEAKNNYYGTEEG